MKKRNLTTIILAVAMIAVLGIGGIMAYFTDYEEVTNSFTYGQVELELTEPNWDEDLAQQVVPNETFAKDPTIKNIGVNDMFVFVEVVVPYENIITANLDGTRKAAADTELFFYDLNGNWTELTQNAVDKNGNAYPVIDPQNKTVTHLYVFGTQVKSTAVKYGESVTPFTEVTAANAIESQGLENKAVDMLVKAYAIQSENLVTSGNGITNPYEVWEVFVNQGVTVDQD